MVIPRLNDGTFLMVNQYRYLASRESIEFPCGSVKRGSDHAATARLELEEETGYAASGMIFIGEFNPYNGVTDEMCRVYLAESLRFIGSRPDDTEEFELLVRSAAQIDEDIRNGTMWDGMSMVAWGLARAKDLV
jgi:ADP-ribose pyrophosphatase